MFSTVDIVTKQWESYSAQVENQLKQSSELIETNNVLARGMNMTIGRHDPQAMNKIEIFIKFMDSALITLQHYESLFINSKNLKNSAILKKISENKIGVLDRSIELHLIKSNIYFEQFALLKGEGFKNREKAKKFIEQAYAVANQIEIYEEPFKMAMSNWYEGKEFLYATRTEDYKKGVIKEYNLFFGIKTLDYSKYDPNSIEYLFEDARNTKNHDQAFEKYKNALLVASTNKDADWQFDIHYDQVSSYFSYMQDKVHESHNMQTAMDYAYKVSEPLIAAAVLRIDRRAGVANLKVNSDSLNHTNARCESISVMLYLTASMVLRYVVCYGRECNEVLKNLSLAAKCVAYSNQLTSIIRTVIPYAPALTQAITDTQTLIQLTIDINERITLNNEEKSRQYNQNIKFHLDSVSELNQPKNNVKRGKKIAPVKTQAEVKPKYSEKKANIIRDNDKECIVYTRSLEENLVLLEDAKNKNDWQQQAYINVDISDVYHLSALEHRKESKNYTNSDISFLMIEDIKITLRYLLDAVNAINEAKRISIKSASTAQFMEMEKWTYNILEDVEMLLSEVIEKYRAKELELLKSRQTAIEKAARKNQEWHKDLDYDSMSRKAKELIDTRSQIKCMIFLEHEVQNIKFAQVEYKSANNKVYTQGTPHTLYNNNNTVAPVERKTIVCRNERTSK